MFAFFSYFCGLILIVIAQESIHWIIFFIPLLNHYRLRYFPLMKLLTTNYYYIYFALIGYVGHCSGCNINAVRAWRRKDSRSGEVMQAFHRCIIHGGRWNAREGKKGKLRAAGSCFIGEAELLPWMKVNEWRNNVPRYLPKYSRSLSFSHEYFPLQWFEFMIVWNYRRTWLLTIIACLWTRALVAVERRCWCFPFVSFIDVNLFPGRAWWIGVVCDALRHACVAPTARWECCWTELTSSSWLNRIPTEHKGCGYLSVMKKLAR